MVKLNAAFRLLSTSKVEVKAKTPIKSGDFVEIEPPVHGRRYGRVQAVKGTLLQVLAANSKANLRFGIGKEAEVLESQCSLISIVDIPN
jgi:hypothetical protein